MKKVAWIVILKINLKLNGEQMKNKLLVGFNKSPAMRKSVLLAAVLGIFSLPSYSFASVSTFTDQSAFNSQGVIAFNSNFQDFGTGFGFPVNPFTRGGVTYTSGENITWGFNTPTPYNTTLQTLIGNNSSIPTTLITGNIATGYNMFGFNIGTYGTTPISITVNTNLSSYLFSGLSIANSGAGLLDYKGFIATSGEYFTGFKISADNVNPNLAGITNVSLGNVSAVPVPGAVWLFVSGLLGLGALRKKAQA